MGVERIARAFNKEDHKSAFMPYVVAGYPDMATSARIIKILVENGADLIELGVPFSDPIADGPVIQAAGQQSLAKGTTLRSCLDLAARLRSDGVEIPFILMSYVNPLIAYGLERIVESAVNSGIDGFIIPDLPPEEAGMLESACDQFGAGLIYLLAPTSSQERIKQVAERASGFIYLVSLTGVTGARDRLPAGLSDFVGRVRSSADLPLAVGFGISNGEQAAVVAQSADGVIVGSALVSAAGRSLEEMRKLAEEIHGALI